MAYFADQDSTHEFKTVLMYEWGDWDFASTFIYATGRPYTEVLGVIEDSFPASFEVGEKNAERYDDYHRLDTFFEKSRLFSIRYQWYTETLDNLAITHLMCSRRFFKFILEQ